MVLAFVWVLRRAGSRRSARRAGARRIVRRSPLSPQHDARAGALARLSARRVPLRRHPPPRGAGALACVYTWLYDGFPLLMIPVAAVVAAELVTERRFRPGIVAPPPSASRSGCS
jgi:hypothetical protein